MAHSLALEEPIKIHGFNHYLFTLIIISSYQIIYQIDHINFIDTQVGFSYSSSKLDGHSCTSSGIPVAALIESSHSGNCRALSSSDDPDSSSSCRNANTSCTIGNAIVSIPAMRGLM